MTNKPVPNEQSMNWIDPLRFENTQLVWVDDTRTLVPLDQPEILTRNLRTFLADNSSPKGG